MKKRLYLLAIFAVAAAALVLGGCAAKKKNPAQIRVVLDWTPNTNHTGLYVAQEKGWFTEEGLTVEIMQPPEDGSVLLTGSGNAEFGIEAQEIIGPAIAKEKEALPIIAVAAIISHNTSGIMSLEKTNIKSPRDLAGKRYESWETPLVTAIIKEIVENDGGKFEDVLMIPNYSTDPLSALQTDMDAIWVFYAWEGLAAEVNGFNINFIDLGRLDSRYDFYTPIIFANTDWLEKNPETAKKFMRAVSKGYNFAIENPAEAAEILLKHAPELDRTLVKRSQEYLASRYRQDVPRWGEIEPERWAAFYRWMYSHDLLEKNIGYGGFTNEYLPK
jgi:ABC-type nitrate/sulfonate/bicarbonate transport system substrate-binding protein